MLRRISMMLKRNKKKILSAWPYDPKTALIKFQSSREKKWGPITVTKISPFVDVKAFLAASTGQVIYFNREWLSPASIIENMEKR